jgi:hypothetical protein
MGNCRWIPSSVTPSGSLNPDGTVNWAAFSTGDQAVLIVGKENYDKIVEAVVLDIVNQGEDAADASAIAGGSQISVMQDNVNSKYYAVADSTKAGNAYIGFFELKCGAALNYPFMIGGAVVLGGIGFALGGKLGKGKHKALLGALVGSAAGVGAGLLAAKLATPSYMKAAGLGAVQARCQPGTRWSHALKRCVSPQRDPWA